MKGLFISCCVIGVIYFASCEAKTETSVVKSVQTTSITNSDPYDMNPWPSERLSNAIELPNCPWTKVIEWRKPARSIYGGSSELAKKTLGNACAKAVKAFPAYIKHAKYNMPYFDINTFQQSLSLIPALEDSEGFQYRNLNDIKFRFRNREKSYNNLGQVNPIWGYTNFHNSITYVRNDVINEDGTVNKKTVTVFVHELYHALSSKFRVNDAYHNDSKIEEEMALNFTQYLGYGK